MTNLTNFDCWLYCSNSWQKAIMVGKNVVNLTEVAYIPLYTSQFLFLIIKRILGIKRIILCSFWNKHMCLLTHVYGISPDPNSC